MVLRSTNPRMPSTYVGWPSLSLPVTVKPTLLLPTVLK